MTNEEQLALILERTEGGGKEIKSVALGEDFEEVEVVEAQQNEMAEVPWPEMTAEDKERWRREVNDRLSRLVNGHDSMWTVIKEMSDRLNANHNAKVKEVVENNKSDLKIPEGTKLWGTSRNLSYFCMVKDGAFYVGTSRYESLSAAAEGVSGVRRSGWTFWKMPDGRTVKEAYKEV